MKDAYLDQLLGQREKILLITRQHWFVLLRSILFEILLIIAIIVAVTLIYIFINPTPLTLLGFGLLVFPLITLSRDIMIWNNHKYVVTNRRVIQVFGIFNKNVTDSSLEKVNDVKMDQSFMGRIFNYGDVDILTASELGINRFTTIGDPIRFKTAMIDAKYKLEQDQVTLLPAASTAMDVPRLIHELDSLRQGGLISEEEFREKKAKLLAQI